MTTNLANAGTDMTSAVTGIVSASIALLAMIGSLVGWYNSRKKAREVSAALSSLTTAQQTIADTAVATRTDEEKAQARQVVVETANFQGQLGLSIRNASTAPVFDAHVDLVGGEGQLRVRSARGVNPVTDGRFIDVLNAGQSTITNSIFVREGGPPDMADFLSHFRIRFRDSREVWWQRVGNREPVEIEQPSSAR